MLAAMGFVVAGGWIAGELRFPSPTGDHRRAPIALALSSFLATGLVLLVAGCFGDAGLVLGLGPGLVGVTVLLLLVWVRLGRTPDARDRRPAASIQGLAGFAQLIVWPLFAGVGVWFYDEFTVSREPETMLVAGALCGLLVGRLLTRLLSAQSGSVEDSFGDVLTAGMTAVCGAIFFVATAWMADLAPPFMSSFDRYRFVSEAGEQGAVIAGIGATLLSWLALFFVWSRACDLYRRTLAGDDVEPAAPGEDPVRWALLAVLAVWSLSAVIGTLAYEEVSYRLVDPLTGAWCAASALVAMVAAWWLAGRRSLTLLIAGVVLAVVCGAFGYSISEEGWLEEEIAPFAVAILGYFLSSVLVWWAVREADRKARLQDEDYFA